ncbi:NAD(P)-dependent oxidoreductase [Streptacidiphilus sp. N1-12]|uniref:NAD(P)-dependent oxidoreductase n=2 Tax=Streptacidiphilus alkalitolerans TaxID=3342712 RepID=A0ABV6VH77_9ACTN
MVLQCIADVEERALLHSANCNYPPRQLPGRELLPGVGLVVARIIHFLPALIDGSVAAVYSTARPPIRYEEVGMYHILWFGTGRFGSPMVSRLVESGFAVHLPRSGHGTESSAALVEAGAHWWSGGAVDLYGLCLPRTADVVQTMDNYPPGAGVEVLDFSTGDPRQASSLLSAAQARGAGYMDCPVSGSAAHGRNGNLTMWIGSERSSASEPGRQTIDALSQRQFWMGRVGAGFSAKLVNQVIHILNVAAIGEGLKLAEALDLPRDELIESLRHASSTSAMLDRFGAAIAAHDHTAHFRLELAAKDIEYASNILKSFSGVQTSYIDLLRDDLNTALSRGEGDANFTTFIDN